MKVFSYLFIVSPRASILSEVLASIRGSKGRSIVFQRVMPVPPAVRLRSPEEQRQWKTEHWGCPEEPTLALIQREDFVRSSQATLILETENGPCHGIYACLRRRFQGKARFELQWAPQTAFKAAKDSLIGAAAEIG